MRKIDFALLGLASLSVSCSTIYESKRIENAASVTYGQSALGLYFLPKARLVVSVSPKEIQPPKTPPDNPPVPPNKKVKAKSKAKVAAASPNNTEVVTPGATPGATPGNVSSSPAIPTATSPNQEATKSFAFSLESIIVPDENAHYSLSHNESWIHDDLGITFSINNKGLLESTDNYSLYAKSENKLAQIAEDFGTIAKNLSKIGTFGAAVPAGITVKRSPEECKPFKGETLKFDFDPSNSTSADFSSQITMWSDCNLESGQILSLQWDPLSGQTNIPSASADTDEIDGLLYHPVTPFKVTFRVSDKSGTNLLERQLFVYIPDTRVINTYEFNRGIFASKNETEGNFKDGVLMKGKLTRQSEISGFMDIPVKLSTIPADLIYTMLQLKVLDNKINKAELDAENSKLQSQVSVIKSLTDIQYAQSLEALNQKDAIAKLNTDIYSNTTAIKPSVMSQQANEIAILQNQIQIEKLKKELEDLKKK